MALCRPTMSKAVRKPNWQGRLRNCLEKQNHTKFRCPSANQARNSAVVVAPKLGAVPQNAHPRAQASEAGHTSFPLPLPSQHNMRNQCCSHFAVGWVELTWIVGMPSDTVTIGVPLAFSARLFQSRKDCTTEPFTNYARQPRRTPPHPLKLSRILSTTSSSVSRRPE